MGKLRNMLTLQVAPADGMAERISIKRGEITAVSPIFMGHEWLIFKNSNDAGVSI